MTYVINQPQEQWVQYTLDGVTYDIAPKMVDDDIIMLSEEEALVIATKEKNYAAGSKDRKLKEIKEIRLQKLIETDYLSNSDVTMPDNIKTWRQSLRDIPQDNTTEEQYDLLLAKDENKQLTHAIWSKPE
tara:strand:+ start:195 stop:584 length:390 start_codon:yes stop_codon:yes gene_type:complete